MSQKRAKGNEGRMVELTFVSFFSFTTAKAGVSAATGADFPFLALDRFRLASDMVLRGPAEVEVDF